MKFDLFPLTRFACLLFAISVLAVSVEAVPLVRRDHLTRQEADMVRDTQELDKRINILIKAADRRLVAVFNPSAAKLPAQETELLGELKGTRADFLYDISKILDEAITNIDDVSSRDEKNPLVPKSVRKLAEASTRILTQLKPLRDQIQKGTERQSLELAIENSEAVLEAAGKLPPPSSATKKKGGDKP